MRVTQRVMSDYHIGQGELVRVTQRVMSDDLWGGVNL